MKAICMDRNRGDDGQKLTRFSMDIHSIMSNCYWKLVFFISTLNNT